MLYDSTCMKSPQEPDLQRQKVKGFVMGWAEDGELVFS